MQAAVTDAMPTADGRYDVIVIGGGAAGLFAAIEAADAGAETILLESESEIGGSTRLAAGYVALCETELQPGHRDELFHDLTEAHHGDSDEALRHVYVDNAADTYRRLKVMGIEFTRTFQFAHMRKPWGHELPGIDRHGGAEIVQKLAATACARGVSVVVSTRVLRLVRDGDGRIGGVEAAAQRGRIKLFARRAVVLATGGFTRNPELIKNFGRPGTGNIMPITGPGSRGDGLVMGMAAGAGTAYLGVGVAPTGPAEPVTGKGALPFYSGGIIVNKAGRRFCRESDVYIDISWAGLKQTSALMIQIYDSRIKEQYLSTMMGKVLRDYKEYSATTLVELTAMLHRDCGLDAAAAIETVRRYNGYVEAGCDPEFGRSNLVGTAGDLMKIAVAPFHGAVTVPATTHFNGGLKIDSGMRVVDVFGDVIPGLFAAGEVTGGFHGAGYLSASNIGMALIFGRIAGKNAARA